MRSGALLSVRAKATRLPGKVLKPLGTAATVTEHLLRRLLTARSIDAVVLATSADPRDNVLCDIARACGVPAFQGSADDKLRRYRDAAAAHDLDFVVVVDGDDPFVSIEHLDRIVQHAKAHGGDYVIFDGLPVGATGFGLSRSALKAVCEGRPEKNTEIWARFFLEDSRFSCVRLAESNPRYRRPDIRMTLDYPEDYAFFVAVADGLAREGQDTTFANVMDFLARYPATIELNRGVQVAYEQHLRHSAE